MLFADRLKKYSRSQSRNNTQLTIHVHTLSHNSCRSFKHDQFPNKCQVLIMPIAWGQEKITLIHDALKNSGVYSDS